MTGLIALAAAIFFWRENESDNPQPASGRPPLSPTTVTVKAVEIRDVAVTQKLNGIITAIQSVDVRPQVSAVIRKIHIREGQSVKPGELLFTLDMRTEDANLNKARAQVEKTRADLRNAERHLQRQNQLYTRNFIARSMLDEAEKQTDLLRNQLKLDLAAVQADQVARSHGEIRAPISGRTGVISFHSGALVRPDMGPLISITQIDPIHVSFELPEQALPDLQAALGQSEVVVEVHSTRPGLFSRQGKVVFIDNKINAASGTILVKAEISNPDNLLWPGQHVELTFAQQVLRNVATVPAPSLMVGPRGQFVYIVAEDDSVRPQPVRTLQIQDGVAAVEGIMSGTCVVIEGMQQVFPGSKVKLAHSEENQQKCTRAAAPENPAVKNDRKQSSHSVKRMS